MPDETAHHELARALFAMGLARPGDAVSVVPLSGGVSCDVYKVTVEGRTMCVKRALEKLRVAAEWRAPARRSVTEVAWMRLVAGLNRDWAPEVLGEDRAQHIFAMRWYPPKEYPVWKAELAAGRADADFAAAVGAALAAIHRATAGREDIARQFDEGAQFHALRIEPYLLYTAARHEDVAPVIRGLAQGIAGSRIALMHGDMSPKNILCGPEGPVFLDAETACYGDPAFDLAFCLNHLLLKGVWHPEHGEGYARCFAALKDAYLAGADWEDAARLDARAAKLLAALLIARIDGKSPVEYLTDAADKDFVRAMARTFLAAPGLTLDALLRDWRTAERGRSVVNGLNEDI